MPRRQEPGHYDVGRVEESARRPGDAGTFGVIKGKVANENGRLEWRNFIGLQKSKWFAFRTGPRYDSNWDGVETELLEMFDTKSEAVDYLQRRKDFDTEY